MASMSEHAATPSSAASRWQDSARCRGIDPDVFFDPERWPDARRVCADCKVRLDCLAHALDAPEPRGIWGGLTPAERARHRSRHTTSDPTPAVTTGPSRRISDNELRVLFAHADATLPAVEV